MRVEVHLNGFNRMLTASRRETIVMAIAKEVRKRRAQVLYAKMPMLLEKKRAYKKKQYWVAPYLRDRLEHSFYHVSLPKLTVDDGVRFHNYFRMSTTQLEELMSIVGPYLVKQNVVRESIGPKERLVITLRYLASGDSMTSMSYQYLIELTTVCNIIRETCEVIWNTLCPLVLPPSLSEEDWLKIANNFEDISHFVHCIGAIDGKHIIIQCPNNAGSTYYNYKNSHSVVLLAICDAHYIFSFVDIGACGRRSDGGIFGDSAIGKNFNAGRMNVPKQSAVAGERILPYCLVGDEAFPLKPYLLRPYPGKNGLTLEQDIFNYRLSRARRFIENAFGILVSQWQIFRKPIIAKPENAKLMVQATICLHNWLCKDNIGKNCYVPADMVDEINASDPSTFIPGTWRRIIEDGCAFQDIGNCGSNNSARNCIQIRDEFCDYFFNEGAVPWQNNRHK
ncbi:PREDICTED: putative nuclease HARBI1 [Cyphomyrmex costatus]|uniref:putative nuclease HARBI1 n=1 Tax=Cyphomyrmex costatus TaxID=456900 RepID=UPI0008521E36|nr:PREDICTED: putative nuclease HARBI1 [Cyphomyrmex costatus]